MRWKHFQAGKQIEGNSLMQTLCFNEIVAYEYLEDYQQAEVLMNAYLQNYPDDRTQPSVINSFYLQSLVEAILCLLSL